MLGADGAEHRRLRSCVDGAFARRNIDGMSNRISEIANDQLEKAAIIARRDGQFDLIEHFARPFPLTVICELLGLPLEDRQKFREWFKPIANASSIFSLFSMGRGIKQISEYLKRRFECARNRPSDGLITDLVQTEHEGTRLSEPELLSMVFLLLIAGHETTVHLISNSILTLFQNPNAKDELLSDWSKCDATIEEVLRYSSPVQMSKPRYVAQDIEFYGVKLKKGAMISALIAAANHDPIRFEHPDVFDIKRKSNYHMTFGSGPHTCLGIKLARSETAGALRGIFNRWPNLQPEFDLSKPDWSRRPGLRGLNTLMVRPA